MGGKISVQSYLPAESKDLDASSLEGCALLEDLRNVAYMTRTESIQAQKSTGQILIFLLFLDLPGTEVMQETEKQTAKEERSSCSERYQSEERGATNALLGFTQAFVRLFSWWVCAPTHNCCAVGTKLWQCRSEIVFPLSWAPCRLLRAMTLWS